MSAYLKLVHGSRKGRRQPAFRDTKQSLAISKDILRSWIGHKGKRACRQQQIGKSANLYREDKRRETNEIDPMAVD